MVNAKTDFFKIVNNFSRIEKIASALITKHGLTDTPQVSIVIPTYRRPHLLKAAIESALNQQHYLDFEVIVVDDDPERNCSTEQLIKTIAHKRLSYYKNTQNLGAINNWNRCFELAVGKWVVMLHDDDLLLDFFLNDCMFIINQQPQIGIIKPKWYHWNDDGNAPVIPEIKTTNSLQRVYEISQVMCDRIGAPTGIIVNKEKYMLVGGFNPDYSPSSDKCFVTLFAYYFEVYQLDKVASVYRWLCNDSLKVETLASFLNNDYYLFKYLCKRFGFPGIVASNFLNFKFRNITGYYQTVNRDFSFDTRTLGLKAIHKIKGKIFYRSSVYMVAAYNSIYKMFGSLIFKRRQLKLIQIDSVV